MGEFNGCTYCGGNGCSESDGEIHRQLCRDVDCRCSAVEGGNAERDDDDLAPRDEGWVDDPAHPAPAPGTKALRYAELRLWFQGRDPLTDPPDEAVGVMQANLDETRRFAAAVLTAHYHGECGCQQIEAGVCTCPAGIYGHRHAETCPKYEVSRAEGGDGAEGGMLGAHSGGA